VGGKRIIVNTWGSYGDFNPHAALALGLRDRGHDAVFAGPAFYRDKVETLGVPFVPIRPDLPDPAARREIIARMMDPRRGTERVVREIVLPGLVDAYADLQAAAAGADLIVSSLLAAAGRLVAETRSIRWVSTALQPSVFFSAEDPPAVEVLPGIATLRHLPPGLTRAVLRVLVHVADRWAEPWYAFRAGLGLPPVDQNPFLQGQHAPLLALGLFSPLFAPPQRDWPPQAVATGFPFDPRVDGTTLPPELEAFLAAGESPIVFTLGSSAVLAPGRFYEQSIGAARVLGRRAVLMVGPAAAHGVVHRDPDMLAVEQASHRELFPQASAVVHHGGIGTTAQALRAGVPALIVPHAHDQPDNARHAANLGVALVLHARRYRADRAARALDRLLREPALRRRAEEVAGRIRAEDGVAAACALIDRVLDGR
jgi:UDP:flavonoid glycosyltransferase YjiC (YdhE family)